MNFKDGNKLFWSQFSVFFVYGIILLTGYWLVDGESKGIFQDSFFEHFAMKSIILIFILCTFNSGVFLAFAGKANLDRPFHKWIYKFVIKPPIELGISLASVAFSLGCSLAFVLVFDSPARSFALLIMMIYILVIAVSYWFLQAILIDRKYLKDEKQELIFGVCLMISAPLLAFFMMPELLPADKI